MKSSNTEMSPNAIAERTLWIRVIEQAIDDAIHSEDQKRIGLSMDVLRAREWLAEPSSDFTTVCELAGLEPCRVRAYAKVKIAQAAAKRSKPSKAEMVGVVSDFPQKPRDQSPTAAAKSAEIEFSQNSELSCP
jgi:hypothetical protein